MTAKAVLFVLTLFLVIATVASCAGELTSVDVFNKWEPHQQEKHRIPAEEQIALQGMQPPAEPLRGGLGAGPESWNSQNSIDALALSSGSSTSVFKALLEVLGLQADREWSPQHETAQWDHTMRRRSAKENTIPHIIHQVRFSAAQGCECTGSAIGWRSNRQETPAEFRPIYLASLPQSMDVSIFNLEAHNAMVLACMQVFLDGQAALEEEERKEERAGKEFRRFNHRCLF